MTFKAKLIEAVNSADQTYMDGYEVNDFQSCTDDVLEIDISEVTGDSGELYFFDANQEIEIEGGQARVADRDGTNHTFEFKTLAPLQAEDIRKMP